MMVAGTINRFVAVPGRPVNPRSENARQPWVAAGVSRRTYYRRKASGAEPHPDAPHLFDAHVTAWLATLGSIERLEHRAYARRCVREVYRA